MQNQNKNFAKVYNLFDRLVDLDAEQQDQLLRSECAGNSALEKEVRDLLYADSEITSGRLTAGLEAAKLGPPRGRHEELIGSTLGPYKLVSVLGRGGAGIVYLGERADRKFSARVAIKVVGETADDILGARFAAEIQILATLNHPNIARLIDAGESLDNYPYIVMEYVHGESLNRYCAEKTLTIEQRLRLFLQICAAVQYAHQNLIVHRDLKPSNVLVTNDGSAKLLDFGIAKLLSTGAPTPGLTRLNDRALTPEYASPEQITGQMVTTASDVYSMGIVLYELLAGLPPYQLKTNSPLEMERAVCVVDPSKPSVAVASAAHPEHAEWVNVKRASTARRLTPNRLRTKLAGDLDAIVMRAIRKEPDKRYASVAMFAEDIERYLNREAVAARQGNWSYYTQRLLRRQWIPFTAASIVAVVLLVSAIAMTLLYRQARVERDRAEQASKFMSAIFSDINPDVSQGRAATALDLLDIASERLGDLSSDPQVQARLRSQVGEAYFNLGRYAQAVEHLRKAAELERKAQDNPVTLATTVVRLADAERGDGKFDAADGHYREVRRLLESQHDQSSSEYAYLLRVTGQLENIRGDLKAAEHDYLKSIEIFRHLNGGSTELALALIQLAELYGWTNELPAAERAGREALAIVQRTLPERHPDRVHAQSVLADVLAQKANKDEAATLLEQVVSAQRVIFHNDGPELAHGLYLLAWIKKSQGKLDEAERLMHESLKLVEQALGPEHFNVGYYHTSVARLALFRKHLPEAEKHLRTSLAIFAKSLPKDHQYVASSQYWLGETLLAMHRLDEAVEALTTSRDIWIAAKAAPWFVARSESALGEALAEQGKATQAEKYLRESYKTLLTDRGPDDEATRLAYQRLQSMMKGRGQTRVDVI